MLSDRKHIAEQLVLQASKINPAFCVGHNTNSNALSAEEEFTLAFFLHCSNEDLKRLNDIATLNPNFKDILVTFSVENAILSSEDMKNFDFLKYKWEPRFVEDKHMSEATLRIIFYH